MNVMRTESTEMIERVAQAIEELKIAPDNAPWLALQMPICRTIAIAAIAAMEDVRAELRAAKPG
jgi:hypothetical protein